MENSKKPVAPKINVNNAARLNAALIANERLKKERLSESDRLVLARNLGILFQKCLDRNPSISLRQIFIETFGVESGVSAYKKRDRLVVLPTDIKVKDKLAQKARQYRELAIALSKYIELPENEKKENAEILSILRLIEGSSFDMSTAHKDRFNHEYQVEIDSQLRKLTDKVADSVDIDWIRTWSEMHDVPIIGKTGDVSRIDFRTSRHYSEYVRYDASNLNLDGELACCLAPCINLGAINSTLPMTRYIDVEIAPSESEGEIRDVILNSLTKALKSDQPLLEMEEEDIGYLLQESQLWRKISGDNNTSFENYHVRRYLDLELRYEEKSNKWFPCIISRYSATHSFFTFGSLELTFPDITILSVCHEVDIIFAAKKIGNNKYRVFPIGGANYIGSHSNYFGERYQSERKSSWCKEGFRGLDDVDAVHPLDERYFSVLLQTDSEDSQSCYFDPLINSWFPEVKKREESSLFVKAPKESLAYQILLNIAYAPEDKRIDNLLISDAKKKFSLLKDYSEKAARDYEEAMSKF